MGDVLVRKGTLKDGTIATLDVSLHGLPDRSIDRDTAIAWMKDGHSFIPVVDGVRQPALLLIEVGDAHFIRSNSKPEAADVLGS